MAALCLEAWSNFIQKMSSIRKRKSSIILKVLKWNIVGNRDVVTTIIVLVSPLAARRAFHS